MDAKIRVASRADAGELCALVNAAYRGRAGWTNESGILAGERISLQGLLEELSVASVLVAENARGELVGSVAVHPDHSLGMVSVRADCQNQKLGQRLLLCAEACAAERGAREVSMSVLTNRTELLDWYQRRGYSAQWDRVSVLETGANVGRSLVGELRLVRLIKSL